MNKGLPGFKKEKVPMLQDRHPWGGDTSLTAQGMPPVSMMPTTTDTR